MYIIKDNVLRISVRNLMEFLCRSGDIDIGQGGAADVRAMQEGARLHRMLQKRMGASYHSEVALKLVIPHEEYSVSLEGRADGIICDMQEDEDGEKTPLSEAVIDEIKTMQADVTRLSEPVYVHKAQAMCYAYIFASQHKLDKIAVQLTYCNSETEEIKRFREDFAYDDISGWFSELMSKFTVWTDFIFSERKKRQASIEGMEFPFEYRKGQRGLVVSVYKAVEREKTLYIQASTGVGKTISTIFPSVAAMGQGLADKIFYLTSKTITRSVAENTFAVMRENGLHFRTVTITARDKICPLKKRRCSPDSCPYAKGHFDRVNDAIFDVISHNEAVDRELLEKYAEKHCVCPSELGLDVSYWCDGIICDYNYVFDPNVALKRYFGERVKGDYIFLVDEAHNLVDRAREMYSAVIVKEDFLAAKKLLKSEKGEGYIDKRLASRIERCNKSLLEMKRECGEFHVFEGAASLGRLPEYLEYLASGISEFLDKHRSFAGKDELLEFFFKIRHFLAMYDCADDKYVVYAEHDGGGRFCLKLFCVDPSGNIADCLAMGRSTVFFSATLLPVKYFKEMLSGDTGDYAVYAESSFDEGSRCVLVGTDVSSRYTRRNENEYKKICRYIYETLSVHPGKYMVFFPSYGYMEAVSRCFSDMYGCVSLTYQNDADFSEKIPENRIYTAAQLPGMSEAEREWFLKLFDEGECKGSLVGMCVTGGVFSEGIDLREDRLIGVIVVGTGIPMICRERDILKSYFDGCGRDGYAYAYVFPGMNRVLQAAGRVIRTNEDRGVIELLDDRFLREEYRLLYPREWKNIKTVTKSNVGSSLEMFWNEKI